MREFYKEKLVGHICVREYTNLQTGRSMQELYLITDILTYEYSNRLNWMSVYCLKENKNIEQFSLFSQNEFEKLIQLKAISMDRFRYYLIPE